MKKKKCFPRWKAVIFYNMVLYNQSFFRCVLACLTITMLRWEQLRGSQQSPAWAVRVTHSIHASSLTDEFWQNRCPLCSSLPWGSSPSALTGSATRRKWLRHQKFSKNNYFSHFSWHVFTLPWQFSEFTSLVQCWGVFFCLFVCFLLVVVGLTFSVVCR